VAAASVVTADVPAYAIVAGNPARVVRRRYEDADVARLLAARWWDWPADAVTAHVREIMAGDPARLQEIATGLGT
jgi:virginiamycin A acetyltransferase